MEKVYPYLPYVRYVGKIRLDKTDTYLPRKISILNFPEGQGRGRGGAGRGGMPIFSGSGKRGGREREMRVDVFEGRGRGVKFLLPKVFTYLSISSYPIPAFHHLVLSRPYAIPARISRTGREAGG